MCGLCFICVCFYVLLSFMATNNKQTKVTLVKKFDHWKYSWWNSINKRMPWFDKTGTHNKALLTTSGSPTFWPSGSVIYGNMEYDPAYWMAKGSGWPGTIWYWINEDDCYFDRKPGEKKTETRKDFLRQYLFVIL